MLAKKTLFTGYDIGKVHIKNRLAMAPMGAFGLVDMYGCFNQRAIDYYVERAKGGTGLLISSVCKVENTVDSLIPGFLPCTDIDPARFVLKASEMTEPWESDESCHRHWPQSLRFRHQQFPISGIHRLLVGK